VLLAVFVAATILVWSEQVPTYVAAQGIVVMQYPAQPAAQPTVQPTAQATVQPTVQPTEVQPTAQPVAQSAIQPSRKSAPATRRLISATEKPVSVIRRSGAAAQRPTPAIEAPASATERPVSVSEEFALATERPVLAMEQLVSVVEKSVSKMEQLVSVAEKPVSRMQRSVSVAQEPIPIVMAVFFLPPAQAQSLHAGMPISLNIISSGRHIDSQITNIVPDVMTPAALRSLFHLENTSLAITEPSMIVVVKLDNALAARYVGSLVTANLQLGSQRLISFLPGIGGLFGQ